MNDESCGRIRPLLSAAADGELSSAERSVLDAHLGACPACARRLAALRALGTALRAAGPEPVAAAASARLDRAVAGRGARSRHPWRLAALTGLAAAAALAIALLRGPGGAVVRVDDMAGLQAGASELDGYACRSVSGAVAADQEGLYAGFPAVSGNPLAGPAPAPGF